MAAPGDKAGVAIRRRWNCELDRWRQCRLLTQTGAIGCRVGSGAGSALAARRPVERRNRDGGDAVLFHDDVANQDQLTAATVGLELPRADLLTENGGALLQRFESFSVDVERRLRACGYGNGFDLDIANATVEVASRQHDQRETRAGRSITKKPHHQTPGGLMPPMSAFSLSEASRISLVSFRITLIASAARRICISSSMKSSRVCRVRKSSANSLRAPSRSSVARSVSLTTRRH